MAVLRSSLRAVLIVGAALLLYGCSDASSPTGPGASDPTNGGTSDGGSTTQFDSRAAPGESAEAFLSGEQFTELTVEVDYMEGYRPTEEGLDSLKSALERHLAKSSITIATPTSIPAQGNSTYSAEDIRDLEAEHRDHFTQAGSETIWAYFLVLDGTFTDESVVGVAYYNTSMAFFGKTIEDITGGLTQPSRKKVEATVFRHEFGHNLGLVNNGIPMQQDHQDEEHGPHCTNEQCVMYYAIETTDFFRNVFDGTIPGFGPHGTEDMAAQR